MIKKAIAAVGVIAFAITVYHPGRHAKHYEYVRDADVSAELVRNVRSPKGTNLKECSYEFRSVGDGFVPGAVHERREFRRPTLGGYYEPEYCVPLYKVAILIPYRNREEQLATFLQYMHPFLQSQRIAYRIFVAEQNDTRPFNRAKMFNYAASAALKDDFECLILHDVDLLPLNPRNLYACSKMPRHMSSCLDTFRFNLPYLGLFGGIVSIRSDQFRLVNGMSNLYDGWGGEDDDFFMRLTARRIHPYRFSPQLSRYTMLKHKKEKPSPERFDKLMHAEERFASDGLNSLGRYIVELRELYTNVLVP